jgi:hypothetical protein
LLFCIRGRRDHCTQFNALLKVIFTPHVADAFVIHAQLLMTGRNAGAGITVFCPYA